MSQNRKYVDYKVYHIVAVLTICSRLTEIMKEPALQKADQDVIGRFVIVKMSGESGHLLRSSSLTVYKTLHRKKINDSSLLLPSMLHKMEIEGREGVKWELGFALFRGWEMGFCALGLGLGQ